MERIMSKGNFCYQRHSSNFDSYYTIRGPLTVTLFFTSIRAARLLADRLKSVRGEAENWGLNLGNLGCLVYPRILVLSHLPTHQWCFIGRFSDRTLGRSKFHATVKKQGNHKLFPGKGLRQKTRALSRCYRQSTNSFSTIILGWFEVSMVVYPMPNYCGTSARFSLFWRSGIPL